MTEVLTHTKYRKSNNAKHWTLDDIPWHEFDPVKADPDMVKIVKAASLVEYNAIEYTRYMKEVFADDPEFCRQADEWAVEEVQHGESLAMWAKLADPTFDFDDAFRRFTEGYQQVPKDADASRRGSRSGEMIARCIVEMGTSNYYTAIKDRTDEPALKTLAARIAADELRHYKLFYKVMQRYQKTECLNLWQRIKVALSRVAETEDDELAYAYYAANTDGSVPYDREYYNTLYTKHAYAIYEKWHIETMAAMLFKAVGLKPHGWLHRTLSNFGWRYMSGKAKALREGKDIKPSVVFIPSYSAA